MQRSDIIFTTGGLGPTQDDLTREGVAKALGETPTVQEEVVRQLEQYFQGRGQTMPAPNIKQAHLIPSARFITNRNGTAPGWWSERNGKIIINMPGPPAEMHPIWESEVAPRLREIVEDEVTITRNIKTLGLSEAAVDEIVSEYFGKENPYLGIYSKADGIHLRIIARARNEDQARGMIAPVENAIETRLGQYIWGYDDETPEMAVGQVLTERGLTLSTMESSTGGFLANSITESPDSYVYFKGGVVAYSDDMKTSCGVPPETIREHGSVSQETANAMARAIRERMGSDFGIGIAGAVDPSDLGGRRPGQVYLAIASADEVREFDLRVPPRRITIKRRASNTVLTELRKMIDTGVGVR
jgi:nicotinamide-nucleotide amidase